jgi:hypothetical protein
MSTRPPRVYSGSYWSTLVGSSTLSAPPSTPRAPPPKRRQRVAAACCWCERNLIATGPLTSPESWPLGAKTVRESSDSLDPPKGSFQYNPRSRRDTAPWRRQKDTKDPLEVVGAKYFKLKTRARRRCWNSSCGPVEDGATVGQGRPGGTLVLRKARSEKEGEASGS